MISRRGFVRSLCAALPVFSFDQLVAGSGLGVQFVNVAREVGLRAKTIFGGEHKNKFLLETTGCGCAFIDYDNDGWLDIFLVNGTRFETKWPASEAPVSRLYKNNRDGTFTDVTVKAGVARTGWGQGVCAGDYDNDGFDDFYVTYWGDCALWRNNGNGTFTDVARKAGVTTNPGNGQLRWNTGCAFVDYDKDGHLDLFVANYIDFDPKTAPLPESGPCTYKGILVACGPPGLRGGKNILFHNNGDGTFTDVSESSGIAKYPGKAWGAVAVDLNNDGRLDLFVANDTVANFLFMNRGNGKFEEIAPLAGVGYSDTGHSRSGMGVDAADLNNDGWMDLFVANIDHEKYALYQNNHDETFDDQADATGIGAATRLMSGWGLKFFDYDNDGNLDLIIANGNPDDLIETIMKDVTYREPLLLFHNDGKTLHNVSAESGPLFARNLSARGLAVGDFDNDGAVDVLISVNDAAPLLLRNTAAKDNHWLGIKLVGRKSNRDAIGARVTWQAGDLKRSRTKVGGGSYMSSHDPRLVLGLGKQTKIDWLEVQWPAPGGKTERFTSLPIDKYITIVEGEGIKTV
jgi:hypothetical protein